MATKKKSKKKIILFTILGLVLVLIFSYAFLFMSQKGLFDGKLTYDYEKAQFAKRKVATAQYLPDPEKLASQEKNAAAAHTIKTNAASLSEDGEKEEKTNVARIGFEQYRKYMEDWGRIDPEGSGKYGGYDIYEIKDEIYFVLDNAPSFNQWFRMPFYDWQDFPDGEVPYYNFWAYNIQYDEDRDGLTVTRVCWSTRFDYLDFENKRIIEYYDKNGDESIIQFQIMRTNYFFDEQDREVVECFVYTVAVDHVGGGPFSLDTGKTGYYQSNEKYYYPVSVQYLKNIKDTSLTKYMIQYCERDYSNSDLKKLGWNIDHTGGSSYDITHRDSIGTARSYLQLDYGGEDNVQMLKVDQVSPKAFTDYEATDILYYAVTADSFGLFEKYYDRCTDGAMPYLSENDYYGGQYEKVLMDGFGDMRRLQHAGKRHDSGVVSGDKITRVNDTYYGSASGLGFLFNRSAASLGLRTGLTDETCAAFVAEADQKMIANEDYAYEGALDGFFTVVAQNIKDNFCLRNEWKKIYKDSDAALQLKKLDENASAVAEKIVVKEAVIGVTVTGNTAHYTASGKVKSSILLQDGKNYSLGLVLKSERGDWYLMDGNASGTRFSRGKELVLSGAGEAKFADLDLKISGTYTLGYALVKEGKTICSEFIPANVEAYEKVEIPEKEENGIVKTYEVTCEDGVLKINFVGEDVEAPTISGVANGSVRTVEKGTPIAYAFYGMNIDDNDEIVCVEFYHGVTKYKNWGDAVVAGLNTLVVRDAAGNETKVTITIIIV